MRYNIIQTVDSDEYATYFVSQRAALWCECGIRKFAEWTDEGTPNSGRRETAKAGKYALTFPALRAGRMTVR